ncbi:MAG: hypothetical protein V4722_10455 [Bacteroidota bacterium]
MKKTQLVQRFSTFITLMLLSLYTFAQDKKVDVEISTTKTTTEWYAQPWVWIVAGAVFVLLLVALLRNNNSKA